MHFTLTQFAEDRCLNKDLLRLFISIESPYKVIDHFWFQNNFGLDSLDKYETNTWHSDRLYENFMQFCEPKNILKAVILDRTFIRGIELDAYSSNFDTAINEIIEIFKLTNNGIYRSNNQVAEK